MTHDPLTFRNLFGSMRGVEFTPSDYEQGQRDMLAKCIAAVEALRGYEMPSTYYAERDEYATGWTEHSDEVLAALRAMEEKP